MNFRLQDNLHFCIANRRVVFLDLTANRYFCLPQHLDTTFQTALHEGILSARSTPEIEQLIGLGVLRPSSPSHLLTSCVLNLLPPSISTDTICFRGDLATLGEALFHRKRAARSLKVKSLNEIVDDLRTLKSRREHSAERALDDRLRRDISTFSKSRHLLSAQDQCLCNSVALLAFLDHRRFSAHLVIGVKMSPFAAHAWVQHDDIVLADSLDTVRPYTPILVV